MGCHSHLSLKEHSGEYMGIGNTALVTTTREWCWTVLLLVSSWGQWAGSRNRLEEYLALISGNFKKIWFVTVL